MLVLFEKTKTCILAVVHVGGFMADPTKIKKEQNLNLTYMPYHFDMK